MLSNAASMSSSLTEPSDWMKIEDSIEGWAIPAALQNAIDKVNQGDDLTVDEEKDWLEYYLFIISDNYTLTTADLLSDHDWWLKCIQYHSSIDEDKMQQFMDSLPKLKKLSLDDFLSHVITFFTIDELKSIGFD
jgi:hypothetical protein